jgi:hypothetical protein
MVNRRQRIKQKWIRLRTRVIFEEGAFPKHADKAKKAIWDELNRVHEAKVKTKKLRIKAKKEERYSEERKQEKIFKKLDSRYGKLSIQLENLVQMSGRAEKKAAKRAKK